MELIEKLRILSDAAKYDVSCSSSGSKRKTTLNGIGNTAASGICHSFTADGRCISLLKILLTNYCIYNCTYCHNRNSNDIERAVFTPQEIADLTIQFYKRNYIEGLFLSSAVIKNPDYTMELLLKTLELLRKAYQFNGYIHVKAIPGANLQLIRNTGRLADRMSANIELPSAASLKLLAPQKNHENILKPMAFIHAEQNTAIAERKLFKKAPVFVPAGQSTQLIVGATNEPDYTILSLSQNLYRQFGLKRVYYSAYIPVNSHPNLPALSTPPLLREHRLYQADWLLRFYGFTTNELLSKTNPNLDIALDPKAQWALNNLHYFPLEVNKAPKHMLLRIPGIGIRSANKIIAARRLSSLTLSDLKKLGVVLKRARYFITCKGQYGGEKIFNELFIRDQLIEIPQNSSSKQLSLFP